MECSNQRGGAELIGTLHLSPNENNLTIARVKTFIICFIRHQNGRYLFYMALPFCFVLIIVFRRSQCVASFIDSPFNACGINAILTV